MNITIEPTSEMYNAPINGVDVPVRIWRGKTHGGVGLEAYVLSVVPHGSMEKFKNELPDFMVPSKSIYIIDTSKTVDQEMKETI